MAGVKLLAPQTPLLSEVEISRRLAACYRLLIDLGERRPPAQQAAEGKGEKDDKKRGDHEQRV
jgi:hypothetical protein